MPTGRSRAVVLTWEDAAAVPIYVGRSPHTDRLQITAEGLLDGAYRIASGKRWLALIGQDTEFAPIEPWAKNNAEIVSGKSQRQWDQITGTLWGLPNILMYKDRFSLPGDTGLPDAQRTPGKKPPPLTIWGFDERGSLNAVYGWLMKLGVRWYAPGEIGEVLPSLATIPLPKIRETVRPDFAIRRFNVRFGVHGHNLAMWAMRLGLRDPYGVEVAHGMDAMTHRDEIFASHPDWFALYGGKRHAKSGQINNHLCYSNPELFEETVRNVRAQFDHYKIEVVSVMPPDGYTAIRGARGHRSAAREAWFSWDSQAEVATHIADDHWTVEMRIPVTQDENDPLHQVIGRKPTRSLPWHINVCRQRIREDGRECSAFSPTGEDHFHNVMKLAYFYDGLSHQFDAEPDNDFLSAVRAAADLARTGKRDEAIAAYTAAAEGKITDLQRSYALEQAAAAARSVRKHELADQAAARIPIAAVKKTVLMQNMLDHYQACRVAEQFAQEDIAAWPFWKRGDGYFARGRAHVAVKAGKPAEADLALALAWTSDPRVRDAIHLALGQNRENNLQDDAAALTAYDAILAGAAQLDGADQFYAVQAIARIQTKRGQFDQALATLRKVDVEKLRGLWHDSMLLARGDTLRAAGRNDEARAVYQSILAQPTVEPRFRKLAEEKIQVLKTK